MRLIDADAFGNRMYHEVFEKDSEDQRWDSGCWMRYRLFERLLREEPTVEQEQAENAYAHGYTDAKMDYRCKDGLSIGKWFRTEAYPHHVVCSVCYNTYVPNDEWDIWKTDGTDCYRLPRKYCPNCGSRMDGEQNG